MKPLDPHNAATARRHQHKLGPGFITRIYDSQHPHKVLSYKHRPGWDRKLPPQAVRVAMLRNGLIP